MGSSMLHAAEPDLIPRLAQRIDAWHRDSPSRAPIRLRVVYFHAADTPPLADYEARVVHVDTANHPVPADVAAGLAEGTNPMPYTEVHA